MRAANEEMAGLLPREFPRVEKDLRGRLSSYRTEIHLGEPRRETLGDATADILHLQTGELESQLGQVEDARTRRRRTRRGSAPSACATSWSPSPASSPRPRRWSSA